MSLESTSLFVIIFIVISVLLNLVEIVAFAAGRLDPVLYICTQVIKTAIWLGLSVFAIYGTVVLQDVWLEDDDNSSVQKSLPALGMAIPVVTLSVLALLSVCFLANCPCLSVACLPPLIYASVVCHHQRQRKAGRMQQLPEVEETLHIPGQDDDMRPMETFTPQYAHIGSNMGIPSCDGVPMNVQVSKTEEKLPVNSSSREMALIETRDGLHMGINGRDMGEPYELYGIPLRNVTSLNFREISKPRLNYWRIFITNRC